jgi:hypothetical protein
VRRLLPTYLHQGTGAARFGAAGSIGSSGDHRWNGRMVCAGADEEGGSRKGAGAGLALVDEGGAGAVVDRLALQVHHDELRGHAAGEAREQGST